jgi:hypothetical protein
MLAAGLARFSQIKKDARSTVDAMARRIGRADQAKQLLILHRSIGEGFLHPCIEPAARHVEETAHDGRIKLMTMGVDERVLRPDTLQPWSITHWTSPCANDHPKGVR